MKFYHVYVHVFHLSSEIYKNLSYDEAMMSFICPFVNQEVTMLNGDMYNLSQWGIVDVFETDRPIDSDWPIKEESHKHRYAAALRQHLWTELRANVTREFFKQAIALTASSSYKALRLKLAEGGGSKESFFVCPIDNPEVLHNYEYVIKPFVKQHHFEINKADELVHTREISGVILEAIARSKFVVADMTDVRPNCYYELGYAHALRKPAIILAKKGTERHFDISMYKWNYWESYTDLKRLLEVELGALLKQWDEESSD